MSDVTGRILDEGGAVYNVQHPDFQALGSDTAAIQGAWDAARAAGGCCYVPEGVYTLEIPPKIEETVTTISFDRNERKLFDSANGLHVFANSATLVVEGSGSNDLVYRIATVASDGSSLTVFDQLTDEAAGATITLTGWEPALRLRANESSKHAQPRLEGAGRGVTFQIAFPAEAPRIHPVINVDRGTLTDQPQGMIVENLRIVNTVRPTDDPVQGVDYRGTGVRLSAGTTGEFLRSFQIFGFYRGLDCSECYGGRISLGMIRNCNFGIFVPGTSNGNSFRNIVLVYNRHVATVEPGLDAARFPGGRVGAGVYLEGASVNGLLFDCVHTEQSTAAGVYVGHGTATGITFIAHRSESVFAPIFVKGPVPSHQTQSLVLLNPHIDCDALGAPAIYLEQATHCTIINPRFYQRNVSGHQVPIEMTTGSTSNRVINPMDGDEGVNGDLIDAMIDDGDGNRIEGRTPRVQVTRSADASFGDDLSNPIDWQLATLDVGGMWTSGTPQRIMIPSTGIYDVLTGVTWRGAAGGYRRVQIRVNGTARAEARQSPADAEAVTMQCALTRLMNKGDYVEVWVRQKSGGVLDVAHLPNYSPFLSVIRRD